VTVERRLRDAMQARVESVDAPAMAVRPERTRRVWPAVTAGFAIVLVVALVVALIARHEGSDSLRPASTPYPSRVVVVTYDGKLQVLDSRTGHVVRTLARDVEAQNGHAGVSVSPDGRRVYFTRTTDAQCDENLDGSMEPIDEIASVSIDGGRVRTEASNVRWPAVSPDGRYLAYSGIPNCSDAGQSIVLKALDPSLYDRRFDGVNIPSGTPGTVYGLAWASDSRHLLFHRDIGSTYPYVLDTATAKAVDDGQRVDIGDGSAVAGYLGDTGYLLGTSAQTSPSERGEVIAVDATSGARERTLFEYPGPWPGSDAASDGTGRNILVSGARLYRWSQGDARPTRIGSDVAAAAWVPTGRVRAVDAPSKIVAVTRDGRLIVASSRDGHMIRLLASDYGGNGFTVSPDGETVYYSRRSDRVCTNPVGDHSLDIVAVPTRGGEPTLIANDALDPQVSPDGRWLAYSGVPNCSLASSSIVLDDLQKPGAQLRVWSSVGGAASVVSPWSIRWRDDNRILFALADGPTRVLDIDQTVTLTDSPVLPVAEADSLCCRVGATGLMAGSRTLAGVTSVWTFDPSSGGPVARLTWPGQPLDADPTGAHLLVYFTDPTHPPVLSRNVVGSRRLVRISSQLYDARWLPGS